MKKELKCNGLELVQRKNEIEKRNKKARTYSGMVEKKRKKRNNIKEIIYFLLIVGFMYFSMYAYFFLEW